jgi:hypothetical protein
MNRADTCSGEIALLQTVPTNEGAHVTERLMLNAHWSVFSQ